MADHSPTATAHTAASAKGASLHTVLYNGRTASHQLHVLIVGCGMGGLAAAHSLGKAGHKVTLFEAAAAIGEVGAGIQVTPNVSRLLGRWGAGLTLEAVGVRPEAIVLRRYDTGERVGYTRWSDMEDKYGSPYYHIHRADLHKLLFDLAEPFMTLRLKSQVVSIDPDRPSLTLSSGEVVHGDLIVGADGIKSLVQRVVLGHTNPAEPTGDAVYRAIVPSSLLLADPELRELVDVPEMTGWMGPGRHIMAYNIVRSMPCIGTIPGSETDSDYREERMSIMSSSRILTMIPSSRGLPRVVLTRCVPSLLTMSHGTLDFHGEAKHDVNTIIGFARFSASSSRH